MLDIARPAFLAAATLILQLPVAGRAGVDPAALCDTAAAHAARQTGVPQAILRAVAIVETGRDGRPWPWTVNLGGDGHWLDSAAQAEAKVYHALDEGRTNVDIGCFQLNYRWHGSNFASVADMLDPGANALYAAEYLLHHYGRTGDWAAAAAAYHSATPEHAQRYQARFETAWAAGPDWAGEPAMDIAPVRLNRFPLLLAGQSGSRGSLVPQTGGGQRLIGVP